MLGADVVVAALLGIVKRPLEGGIHPIGDVERRTVQVRRSARQILLEPLQRRRRRHVEMLEGERDQPLALTQQDQQQVLGVERVVAELHEQLLGATERLTGLLGELLDGNHGVMVPQTSARTR